MKNKAYYQNTFSRLTASEALIQEVLDMDQKKVYRSTKKAAGLAVAAALALTATGAAYAATDGDLSQFWKQITIYVNGEELTPQEYEINISENTIDYTLKNLLEEDQSLSIAMDSDALSDPDVTYSIDIDTDSFAQESSEVPFTLEADDDHLYLVEENGNRIDITAAAASAEGYVYTWKDANGAQKTAIAMGTPEEHFLSFPSEAAVAGASAQVNTAVELPTKN